MAQKVAPLVPDDLDLRAFAYMPLDVVRLRDSDIATACDGEEFRAAVMLWCASWHQVPASSLPDDDKILAKLAGFGRDVKAWIKVKKGALRGFVLCTDGRLYHPVIADKANEANKKKKKQTDRTAAATEARRRAARQRNDERNDSNEADVTITKGKEGKGEEGIIVRADARAAEFAFAGKVVRLNVKDFENWQKAYSKLDLLAELTARDAWLSSEEATDEDRRKWFISTSKYLANRNMLASQKPGDDDVYLGVL
jgi:hypothetical protein